MISLSVVMDEKESKMTFLYVYDKSDMANVSDNKIKQILSNNGLSMD